MGLRTKKEDLISGKKQTGTVGNKKGTGFARSDWDRIEKGGVTVRQLDRIDKEMGYCEVKLEKERRLRCQQLYLQADVEALDEVLGTYNTDEIEACLKANQLGRISLDEVPKVLRRGEKRNRNAIRQGFLSVATYLALREEREILGNELEGINQRLGAYDGFETRRSRLLEQRRRTLEDLGVPDGGESNDLVREFQITESQWNNLSEDFANAEAAVYHVERNLDYLRSGRNFILAGRATFDIEEWRRTGCFSDLFKHSAVGRAFEMVQGAEINVKLAEKELICLVSHKIRDAKIQRVLGTFVHALFDDLFVLTSLQQTKNLLEEAEEKNRRRFEELSKLQEKLEAQKFDLETRREQKFAEMGEEVKRLVCH